MKERGRGRSFVKMAGGENIINQGFFLYIKSNETLHNALVPFFVVTTYKTCKRVLYSSQQNAQMAEIRSKQGAWDEVSTTGLSTVGLEIISRSAFTLIKSSELDVECQAFYFSGLVIKIFVLWKRAIFFQTREFAISRFQCLYFI
jgi:hypothetical protein